MARTPEDVTETELAMLEVLWRDGSATRRQVADAVYPGGDAAHYATVQKLLQRLEAKGYVRHTRAGGVLVFTAVVGRDDLLGRRLRDVAARLCGGSLIPVLMNLVRARPLTGAELRELREFVEEQSRRNQRKGDKS